MHVWQEHLLLFSFVYLINTFSRFLYGDQARFFGDEIHLDWKHSQMGTVAMASAGENLNASQVLLFLVIRFSDSSLLFSYDAFIYLLEIIFSTLFSSFY